MTSITVRVTWRNSYIFLAHFRIYWSHCFIHIFFLLQKKLPTSSPTTNTKPLCFDCCLRLMDESEKRLFNIWTRFLSWMNFSEQLNSSTGFPFPRSWMISLTAISSDSMWHKPFLVYKIKLHFTIQIETRPVIIEHDHLPVCYMTFRWKYASAAVRKFGVGVIYEYNTIKWYCIVLYSQI